ncbi:CIA30 family protein [Polaribacter sp.]|uniref:CIA30 family protein n=1 Tax=Polaribacter sp. TaxID=1920175 RepID=UPI003F6D7F52
MSDSDQILFDFTTETNISNWKVVDDEVMGGRSNGNFKLNKNGHGDFFGKVSLENNGGFSSVRYRFDSKKIINSNEIVIRLKGDGKKYQFRVKDKSNNYYSYIATFTTQGDWENIKINLSDMYPAFRGRKLNMDNFSEDTIEEIAFLIGNKKQQTFKLEIDKIYLQ